MSYFITREPGERLFPYTVRRGREYPACEIIHVAQTLRGARKLIRKDQKAQAARLAADPRGYPVTVERVIDDPADLPDLRKSEYAP